MSTPELELPTPHVSVDATRWPGLASVQGGLRTRVAAVVADRLFRNAAARLDVRVE